MAATNHTLEQVVGFLKSILCDEAVQNRFIEEKMTPEAIINADDNILKRHGLLADGDIIRLRVFCRSIDENARKVELRNTLNTSSSSQRQQQSKKELKSKTVYFTWQNYDINSRKYCIVKSTKGGGPKKKKMPLKTTRGELLEMCKKMYWDKRVKKHFDDNSSFQLADHAGNVITNTLIDEDNNETPFTIENLIKTHNLPRCRIFFKTRSITIRDLINNTYDSADYSSDPDDDDLLPSLPPSLPPRRNMSTSSTSTPHFPAPTTSTPSSTTTPTVSSIDLTNISSNREDVTPVEQETSISSEREENPSEENEYTATTQQEQHEEMRLAALEALRLARLARVEPDLSLEDDHIVIAVRHIELNKTFTRFFKPTSLMLAVHDWVGSISSTPEHFQLIDCNRNIVDLSQALVAGVYNMKRVAQPVIMSPSGTIAFRGFGVNNNISSVEDENGIDSSTQRNGNLNIVDHEQAYEKVNDFRQVALSELSNDSVKCEVGMQSIVDDLLTIYKVDQIDNYKTIDMTIKGEEDAVGHGVLKDAFSEFFDKVNDLDVYDPDELEIIGKVFTHAFLLFGMFPFTIPKASIKYMLFNSVTDEELLQSFFQSLPEKEERMIKDFEMGHNDIETDAIVDILCLHKVTAIPSSSNVMRLCLKAARNCLVQECFFVFQALKEGMKFFSSFTTEMLDSIYTCTTPTPSKILKSLEVNEKNQTEAKVATFLYRFIRMCNVEELRVFLRFCTASSSFLPNTVIKVAFVNAPVDHMAPASKTCFSILYLPRQYTKFDQFRNNLNTYVLNPNTREAWALHDTMDS